MSMARRFDVRKVCAHFASPAKPACFDRSNNADANTSVSSVAPISLPFISHHDADAPRICRSFHSPMVRLFDFWSSRRKSGRIVIDLTRMGAHQHVHHDEFSELRQDEMFHCVKPSLGQVPAAASFFFSRVPRRTLRWRLSGRAHWHYEC